MKCACGYEQARDFKEATITIPVEYGEDGKPTIMRRIGYTGMYACPVCGTMRVKEREEPT